MARAKGEIEVDGRVVDWVRDGKVGGRPLLVLAHGAGASLHSPFMEATARGLDERGICVVRFHFPYMREAVRTERRRPPDPQARLLATWRAMIARARRMRGHRGLVVGGKSMGGRMASMVLARGDAEADGAVYLGYPLHPPGRPEKLRQDHLPDVGVPQLFVQGARDALCTPALLRDALAGIDDAEHMEIAGADHSLALSRRDPMKGADRWLERVAEFVGRVASARR